MLLTDVAATEQPEPVPAEATRGGSGHRGPRHPETPNTFGGDGRILVFPDMYGQPADLPKSIILATVTLSVFVEFGLPPGMVRFRQYSVIRAGMPETTVDEDGDSCSGESHVWPAR